MNDQTPESTATALNQSALDGWTAAMGLRFLTASGQEVTAELEVGPVHRQPHGIVHGGVYAGVIETVTSVGAALWAAPQGKTAVGLENHTSFLRATRSGRLSVVAKPLTQGRRTQVWEGSVRDETGRLLATGQVRLLCIEPEQIP